MSVQPAAAQLRTKPRNAALDGIRGVAIIAVIASHYVPGGFKGGAFGVLVFFVLSGYLITTLLLKEYDVTDRIRLGAFYARRALRLLPALYVFLLLSLALTFLFGTELHMDRDGAVVGAVLSFFYVFNWADFAGLGIPHSMTPLWTLSVEEQFYLIWPLLLVLLLGVPALQRRLLGIVYSAVVVFTLLGVVAFFMVGFLSFYRTWTWIAPLLLGAALAIAERRTRGRFGAGLARFSPMAWCLLLLLLAVPPSLGSAVTYLAAVPLLSLATCAIIARSTGDRAALSTRMLSGPLLGYLGRRSYGLYLWNLIALETLAHFIGNQVVLLGCALAVTFAVTEASYRWVELPALRWKRKFERVSLA